MAELSELSLKNRLFLKTYRWRRIDPVPWTPLRKPLSECRVAIGSSAGFVLPSQEPFDDAMKGGDTSYRTIPADADAKTLLETHRSQAWKRDGIEQDRNLAFPLDRFRELAEAGRIGSVAPRHLSFMGSVTAPAKFVAETAPEAARLLVEDKVDAALLIPI